MALSQIQCLDDNHVNPRTTESKPEFFYCENQRLAVEVLLRDGREAFFKYLEARGLRGFLSDPEMDALSGALEPYDPGSEVFPENGEDDPTPLSQHYWPELSDTSIPQMDLGWPDSDAYRGVTRTTVYTQPPMEGQAHIKEVVRKAIAQAQKVIAVVMDVFTDVDIFRDLLDAGFKKRVSVYILLEHTNLPHFLSMCQRANMHTGHLKHLRVRCTEGTEFYTRSCTKVRGRMGHRFMFVDGAKAVSGSYSFTWMSSRLDRHLITVTTGQAVDGFDRVFRFLYASSRFVDLRQVSIEPEPEPEPQPQPATVAPPTAAVARKLYNPKYALVAVNNPSPTTSAGHTSPKELPSSENSKKKQRRRASEEDAPPLHPGLMNLEKACLISYLPTWPEPDPPSDVIGFINIRDTKKPTQAHLQRSEMFETSQAIRFSSPFNMPKETLPEVAKPRHLTVKCDEMNKLQPTQHATKAKELMVDRPQPAQLTVTLGDIKGEEKAPVQKSPTSVQNPQPNKDTTKALITDNKLFSNTTPNQDAGHERTYLSAHAHPYLSSKTPIPNQGTASQTTQTISTNSPKSDSVPQSNTNKQAETVTRFNAESVTMYRAHTLESNSTKSSQLSGPTDSSSIIKQDTQEKTVLLHTDSHTQAVHMKPENVSTSSASAMQSVSSTLLSENIHIAITTLPSNTTASASVPSTASSPLLTLTSSFTTLNPSLPSSSVSSSLTSAPPVPKPRTVQLVIKDNSTSNSEICLLRKPKTSEEPVLVHNEVAGESASVAPPVKKSETIPELQNYNASKAGAQKETENTENPKETLQQKQSFNSQETKNNEPVERHDGKVTTQPVTRNKLETQSDVLITDLPKAAIVNTSDIIPKDINPKNFITTNCKIAPKIDTDYIPAEQTNTKMPQKTLSDCELAEVTKEKGDNVTQHKTFLARAHEPQRISYYRLTPQDISVFEAADSFEAPVQTPVTTSDKLHESKDSAGDRTLSSALNTHSQQGKQAVFTPENCKNTVLNTAKHNVHSTFQEQSPKTRENTQTPKKTLCLELSDTHIPELQTPTPRRESRLLTSLIQTPTADRFSPRTPTPDSQTPTLDPRSYTPDFRTPTPDISDGYASPREDSNVSTTSEEYFECSDSPFHEPVFEHMLYHRLGTTEDHASFTHTITPNATTPGTSPAYINYSPGAATLSTADRNTFWSETQTLPGPTGFSSSSLLGKKVNMKEGEGNTNEENWREEDEKGRKLNVAEKRAEQESQGTDRKDSKEADKIVDHHQQDEDLTKIAEKDKQAKAPKRKNTLNQSAADIPVDGVTAGELTTEGTQLKQLSSGDLKLVSSAGERPERVPREREKLSTKAASRPGSAERRERPQSSKETEGQKPLHTPSKTQRGQQQDNEASSLSRPPRLARPLSGTYLGARPWENRKLTLTESKALQVLESKSSSRRPPSKPTPPGPVPVGSAGTATGRKQVSQSQQSLLSRQPPAAQSRTRAGQTQNQTSYPKPQASFLHTHSNAQPQLQPQSQSQVVSEQEAQGQEEGRGAFSFSLSKLYYLKDLKDKISKLPAQSKRGSTSPPADGRKSTS